MAGLKLKEITPDMVIKCENEEEVKALWNWFNEHGYVRQNNDLDSLECMLEFFNENDDYFIVGQYGWDIADSVVETFTKFSDLIIKDDEPELTTVDILNWFSDYYYDFAVMSKLFGEDYQIDELIEKFGADGVIKRITEYERGKKETKEKEIKWVYEVMLKGSDTTVTIVETETLAISKCEEAILSGEYCEAFYKRICRVKE